MFLTNIKKRKTASIVITTGVIAGAFAFPYNAIGNSEVLHAKLNNSQVNSVVVGVSNDNYSQYTLKDVFNKKISLWKTNIMFMSFADQIVNDQNFQDIVSLGEPVVPLIVEEISKEPSLLVWALNYIFNKNISNDPNTSIEEACKLWVKALA